MNRVFILLIMLLFLSACGSTEAKMKTVVHEGLKEEYNITEVEILSIEEQKRSIPFLETPFDGKTYMIEVKVNDSVSTVMHAKVNKRKLEMRADDYIEQKHEKLKSDSKSYQEKLSELGRLGIEVLDVTDGYSKIVDKEGNVTI